MQRRPRWRTLHARRMSSCSYGLSTEGGPEGLWETKDKVASAKSANRVYEEVWAPDGEVFHEPRYF